MLLEKNKYRQNSQLLDTSMLMLLQQVVGGVPSSWTVLWSDS